MRTFPRSSLLVVVLAAWSAACAAPIQRPTVVTAPKPAGLADQTAAPRYAAAGRPMVGVAFGGGSARGIAHVGVIRWLAEHRIPIDVAAGTSMGGLIGGSFSPRAWMPTSSRRCWRPSTGTRCSGRPPSSSRTSAVRPTRAPIPRAWSSG